MRVSLRHQAAGLSALGLLREAGVLGDVGVVVEATGTTYHEKVQGDDEKSELAAD